MEIETQFPIVGDRDIGHQVDLAPGRCLETGLPIAAHGTQGPAFLPCHGHQKIAKDAAGHAIPAEGELGGILVNAHADFRGGSKHTGTGQAGQPEQKASGDGQHAAEGGHE